ncbi:MAG: pantoate--beta-alanine ligase [Flexibacter sp. CG_4_10_14_3_um_filter_32_15]|nr:MAG: pantoate--beta-alanine ligase [Flexibacter sp. CG_4_10_14_3_um_filter_32_15]
MKVVEKIDELRKALTPYSKSEKTIGFVPTMGALHKGHISLIKTAKKKSDFVVCSIFVNPLQFNNTGDFTNYPISLEKDIKMLEKAGCDLLFLPNSDTMYQNPVRTKMTFDGLDNVMEGTHRQGHFSGVGIVVAKLFNLVQPNHAFFGQKDLQQFAVIQQMVTDLSFPIELHCCPIQREEDGLAMSSRNRRLDEDQRIIAPKIYESLILTKKMLKKGESVEKAQRAGLSHLDKYKEFETEYLEIVDATTLQPLDSKLKFKKLDTSTKIAICVAAKLGEIRLIDNIIID